MRSRSAVVAAAPIVLVALVGLGGCDSGGGGTATDPPTAEPTAGNAGQDPDATAPAADVEGAEVGGVITVRADTAPVTLDPTRAYSPDSLAILSLVTRALTQYAFDPDTGQMVLVPDMATDLGRPNDDFTEWTFTLRNGLTYADGTEVTPDDVAYAIKRSFATEQLPGGPSYNTTYFEGGDDYRGPYTDGLDYDGVQVDGRDITIEMRRPFGDMPYYAAYPAFTAIPSAADRDPSRYGDMPAATGPYQFESYRPGTDLVLTRNENWDPATDPARHQYSDSFLFEFGVDADQMEAELIRDARAAETTASYTDLQAANQALVAQDPALEERLVTGTSPCTQLLHLDMRQITDVRVRRAVGFAYPYREVWRAQREIEGLTLIPATPILPPGTHGRVDYDPLGNGGAETNTQRARALLEAAGELGFEIRFFYETDNPASVTAKDVVRTALEQAGFRVTPIASTATERRELERDPSAPVNIRSGGRCSDWPTGGTRFPAQWDGALTELADVRNPSFLDEPDVDQRIEDILDNLSGSEANQAGGELDEYIQRKYYPAVPTGYAGVAVLRGSRIGGMQIDSVRGMPTFTDMYVVGE